MELNYQTMDWLDLRRKNKLIKKADTETIKKAQEKRERKGFKFTRDYYRSIHGNPCLRPDLNPK